MNCPSRDANRSAISTPAVVPLRGHAARLVNSRREHALHVSSRSRQRLLQINLLAAAAPSSEPAARPFSTYTPVSQPSLPIARLDQRRRPEFLCGFRCSLRRLHRHLFGFFRGGLRWIRAFLFLFFVFLFFRRLLILRRLRCRGVPLLGGRLRAGLVLRQRGPGKDCQRRSHRVIEQSPASGYRVVPKLPPFRVLRGSSQTSIATTFARLPATR